MSNPKTNCPKCLKFVSDVHKSICCDICDSWYHLNCSKVTRNKFECFLIDKNLTCCCANCLKNALPFQTLVDEKLRNQLNIPSESDANEKFINKLLSGTQQLKKFCAVCNKKIRVVKNTFPCQDCQHLIH